MSRLRSLLMVGALAFATVASCAWSGRPLNEKLQTALEKRLRHSNVKGASAAVILPDGALWRGASGISHPGVKMSPEMAFAIGSITKNMVAALMLQLAEEGKLSLEDPIGKWLPSYPHVNPAITIRQMLNHTSGLFMFWDNQQLWDDLVRYRTKHFTPEAFIVEKAMKNPKSIRSMCMLACLIVAPLIGSATYAGPVEPERFYFGIEISGVLCGYSEISLAPMAEEGRALILLEQTTFAMLSALGSQFNSEVRLTYHIDPVTGRFTYHDSHISQGPAQLSSVLRIEGNIARYLATPAEPELSVPLPPEAILENTLWFPHLVQDFVARNLEQVTYDIFEVREAEVQKSTYTKAGIEPLQLAGEDFNAVILDRLNHKTGLKTRMWLDTATGYLLKTTAAGNRVSYRADPSVVNRIKMANIDDTLCAKVGVVIADVQAITYMKVRATLEPSGLWVTPEGLNVPGQRFTGTISNNLIEGIFEIEHARYDGVDAPAFPADFGHDETLRAYLEPEAFIESDDPVLIAEALAITAGSKDSWEAACRLSRWVAQNIRYAIPGGGTARKTYDLKAGECGAHAMLLAAFCRAVGIPARVVWGCMYAPNYGGVFGQHGWNEIYLGAAGWIPVDATAGEIDFVDSGHLRIGVYESPVTALNPRQMQVLAYRAGAQQMVGPRSRLQTSAKPAPLNTSTLPTETR